jgi:hypothetical protein
MSFRCTLRPFFVALLGALCAAATAHAQQFPQPTVIPTGNWPVSISTGDAHPVDGIPDLVYCDPAVAGVSQGCHLLHGAKDGTFTHDEDVAAAAPSEKYTAAIFDFTEVPPEVVTLSSGLGPNALQYFVHYGSKSYYGSNFSTRGSNKSVPGPFQYILYDKNLGISDTNRGIIAEEMANGYIYSLTVEGGNAPNNALYPYSIELAGGSGPLLTGDFNGDGKTDFLILGSISNTITPYFGVGNGTFTPGPDYTLPGGIFSMLVQDIDGDGIPDLIVEGANGAISYFPGTSTGFSTTAQPLIGAQDGTTGNGGHLIAIADLNGDHIPDIITSTPAGISVLLGQGGLTYKLLGIYNAGPGRSSYALADFNSDDHLDLAVDSPEGIAILYGNADGSFRTSLSYAAGKPAYEVKLGQFANPGARGSGHVDAAVATGIPQFQIFTGDDQGNFAITTPAYPSNSPQTNASRTEWSSLLRAYMDPDTAEDIGVVVTGKPPVAPDGGVNLYFGNNDHTFTAPTVADTFGTAHYGAALLNDFYGAPYIDMIGLDASGCFTLPIHGRSGVGSRTTLLANTNGSPYNLVATGIIKPSISASAFVDAACELNGVIYVNLNNGSGSFNAPTVLPAPANIATVGSSGDFPSIGLFASDLLFQDLDGDGFADIIALYHNLAADPTRPTAATANQLYIYWGNGDGTFTTPTILIPSRNDTRMAIADVDADNKPDLILSDGYLVSVLTQGLSRTFNPEQHYLAGMGINSIATSLVNGKNVIITANGGAVLSSPAINRGTLAANAEVNTGGITVLLTSPHVGTATAVGTLSETPASPGYGRPFMLTADFTTTPGTLPTGTVDFSIDGAFAGTGTIAAGIATFTVDVPAYTVGPHALTAVYSGDTIYNSVNLTGSAINVTLLLSQTSMTSVVSPISYGQIIGDIAVGTEAPLYPTIDSATLDGGTINFFIDGVNACTLPVNGTAQKCPSPTGSGYNAGLHNIYSMYSGNQYYLPSTSQPYPVTVLADITNPGTVTSSLNPATLGQTVTFSAVFTTPFATPTGIVTFLDNGTPVGTGTLDPTGTATLPVSNLAIGPHPITASLTASTNFTAATTNTLSQLINPAPLGTVTNLISSINPSMVGQTVTFTATVVTTPPAGPISGTVVFTIDGVTAATQTLTPQNTAAFSTSTLTLGRHNIIATYSGITSSTSFAASTSTTLVQVVNTQGNFTLTVSPSPVLVPIGNIASTFITITPLNGFKQNIELSCSGLPQEATCAFDTTIITNGGGETRLEVFATAPHTCGTTQPYFITPNTSTTWMGLLATGGLLSLLRRRRRLMKGIILTLALCILPALGGCGNCTDLGVKPGTYTFTVNATSTGSPSVTATQTIQLVAHL